MTVLTIFTFESQLMQMPGPRDIVIYRPAPMAFSVLQKLDTHFGAKAPGCRRVTGQIDTCINLFCENVYSVWRRSPEKSPIPCLMVRPRINYLFQKSLESVRTNVIVVIRDGTRDAIRYFGQFEIKLI